MEPKKYLPLKILRRLYCRFFKPTKGHVSISEVGLSADETSAVISRYLTSDKPCMIARFGSTELAAMLNCIAVENNSHSAIRYILGDKPQWWWNESLLSQIEQWSGFFPASPENVIKFTHLMLDSIKDLDVLARWTRDDECICLPTNIDYIHLLFLEPYWSKKPWTKVLTNKKVLVVHPYAELIEKQYRNRTKLFSNPDILPSFELKTVKAVQSLGGTCNNFKDWFEALDWMTSEIDKCDYDICLIGCGAYGFVLASHVKRKGKKAVHLGGALQLLFGIKGKRWENPNYLKGWELEPYDFYQTLFNNQAWLRPSDYKPQNAQHVENGCYW